MFVYVISQESLVILFEERDYRDTRSKRSGRVRMAGKKTDKGMRVKMHKVMPMVQVSKMGRNREKE